jgi:peptidoglycan/LPS O-acetylase OafA/YrhL
VRRPASEAPKLGYIDALRGWAIILVMASHAFPLAHNLPWTVKRFTNLGFFGVQLFFILSSLTLAASWYRHVAPMPVKIREFLIRRAFRIAPAYFLAALMYVVAFPHDPIDPAHLLSFLTFTNGWSPDLMPTVAGRWIGVPGGWSIEAEMGFYVVFPLLMLALRRTWHVAAAVVVSLPCAWIAGLLASWLYNDAFGTVATDQFSFYALPNQMPVFLIGLLLHHRLAVSNRASSPGALWAILAAAVMIFLSLAFIPLPRIPQPSWGFLASPVVAAIAFCLIIQVLAEHPFTLLVNRVTISIGQASFSAYLLHFVVIEAITMFLPVGLRDAPELPAILVGAACFTATVLASAVLARISFRLIEQPGIAVGRALIVRLRQRESRPI